MIMNGIVHDLMVTILVSVGDLVNNKIWMISRLSEWHSLLESCRDSSFLFLSAWVAHAHRSELYWCLLHKLF